MCLFLIIPLSHGSAILSTNQRTACVAQTCRNPFRHLSTQTEVYCETSMAQYGSVQVTPTFCGGNLICAAPLRTEPTRWKRANVHGLSALCGKVCLIF